MELKWRKVEGTQAERPKEIDTISSPQTVYMRRNILQKDKTQENGETVTAWEYEEVQLTPSEYKEYLEISQIFYTPEMYEMKSRMEEQQLVLASVSANTEYVACLQELSMY